MRLETPPPDCVLQKNNLFTKAIINELLRWGGYISVHRIDHRKCCCRNGFPGIKGDNWTWAGQSQQHSTKRSKMAEIAIKGSKTFTYILYTRKKHIHS